MNLYEMTSERHALHSKNCRMITKIKDIVTSRHHTLRTGKKELLSMTKPLCILGSVLVCS